MAPDLSPVDDALADAGADGYLIDADATDSDQLYLSGFDAPDPFTTLYTPGEVSLLVSGLEYGRATTDSDADVVRRLSDYDYREKVRKHGTTRAKRLVAAEFLDDRGVGSALVPERFPLGVADGLRQAGVDVAPAEDDVVTEVRAVKTDAEVDHVRAAQDANAAAMRAAEDLIAGATVEDGTLRHDGEVLTSERVKTEIERTLIEHGCGLDETIVACGADGADPHDRGSGPLRADEPVVIDVFPRSKATKYHGDMTRTFVRGEPGEEVRRRHELTVEAKRAALEAVEPGVTGETVHDRACEVYEEAGYATLRSDPTTETGYIHSTGHGVGLDVHELPRVAPDGDELEPGHVITIEPGLYDPAVGGMRVEDLVVVTEDGYENLTDYHERLVVD
jgi:Xaa-Pro aminopeptidase